MNDIIETPHLTSTDPAAVEVYAAALMAHYGLDGWIFGWDNARRRLGQADFRLRRISVSRHLVVRNGVSIIEDVVRHEICHALVGPRHGHGPVWKAMARRVGCTPTSCGRADMPEGRIVAVCGGCSRLFRRHLRPRAGMRHWCRRCGRVKGLLTWAVAQEN